ncbi:hypothetical protein [Paraflavitalea speifideaquila]|uniref:hypothetical protein n=1 Tax=Paraflavitalea speifideaquila TaxID=3076558 RepID=UPI0028F09F14|nr:hypothetical protein [Paraflavitalea speifideiaquila]
MKSIKLTERFKLIADIKHTVSPDALKELTEAGIEARAKWTGSHFRFTVLIRAKEATIAASILEKYAD